MPTPKTPFDPKEMPGADKRAILLASVANAIAQTTVLTAFAKLQAMWIDGERIRIQPVMPGKVADSERLSRQHYDLQSLQDIMKVYLDGLTGWQRGEKQQEQAKPFPDVPVEVDRYVESIRNGVPYVMPTHTGA